jgi:hypothetical protein
MTLSRVWPDYEDEHGYYQAFRLIFDMAEQDVGRKIRWGHLIGEFQSQEPYIKAIIVDEHGGQMKGLGQYFNEKYPDYTSDEHIGKIVKVCQTHYFRSITKLAKKGVSKGIANFLFKVTNWEEICEILKGMPGHLTLESYDAAMSIVRAEAAKPNTSKPLANWLKHKESNPWVMKVFMLSAEFDEANRLDRNQLCGKYRRERTCFVTKVWKATYPRRCNSSQKEAR